MFDDSSGLTVIDDTKPLTVTITSAENNGSFILYSIQVYRGFNPDAAWTLTHRYSDFAALNSQFQSWGVDLPLPKKKLFGNLDRSFVEERKRALQMYLDLILQNPLLVESLELKKFLDPKHYNNNFEEESLRQTSMLLRAEPHWKLVEPLKRIGGRINKDFFLVNCETEVAGKQMLTWTEIGSYYSFSTKDVSSILKQLTTLQHPYIVPVTLATFNQNGAHVARPFQPTGSLRDSICHSKVKVCYVKKYLGQGKAMTEAEIAIVGSQILEALVFLQDRGLPYGHLHSGNVICENNGVYKISELENFLLGLPSRHRHLHVAHGKIKTIVQSDVYNFGLLLYEMGTGAELKTPTIDMVPATVPPTLRTIIESILSSSAQKDGLPTLEDLISNIFFAPTSTASHVQPALKLTAKHRQNIAIATTFYETALGSDHKALNQLRRQAKAQQAGDDNKRKRRKKPSRGESMNNKDHSVKVSPTPPSVAPAAPAAPGAPAAPAAPAAPKAPPPPGPSSQAPAAPSPAPAQSGERGAFLNSIQGFASSKLKKIETNDRSCPKV